MLLSANDVEEIGLKIMRVRLSRKNKKRLKWEFHKHFGLSPLDIAECWYQLCNFDHGLLSKAEKSEKGFKRCLGAIYWLWARPKNVGIFASRFDMCVDYCQGKELWKWIGRIAGLSKKYIVWDKSIDRNDTEIFALSADGVDFPMWEIQHDKYPYDSKAMSHKFKSCGGKYIIALSTFRSQCVFIAGPFKGGKGDLDCFKDGGLMKKLKKSGKICHVDRGFRSKSARERERFAYPDYMDSKELHNFKSRSRLRQETYNRRLKHFQCLSETFKNGFEKHGIALRAVAVLVQIQMNNGSPLYCV
ncbi:unknown protein [Seminavis robusta]|uniref:DDE Tnp4 domain-containing protein n=1 Tax=Seminavis robusta TaxID=568900 RepID=A0A9N8EPR5_9STRA|nr:unknown protein [Seminavis robusta]|eukprot:Sro1355_g265530.1 n/a (302) ;mRNA; r:14238-15143